MIDRKNGLTYADSGVDIDAGNRLVDLIKPMVRATARAGADAEIGGFGGLFDLKAAGFKDPVLVAATDGVGTKVKIAIETGLHGGIGIDLVAMSVNDLVVQGAEPLFFLDYFACGKLDPVAAAAIVAGVAEGCRESGCALIGGETAEMPGLYKDGDYDLAGFAVGAAERGTLLPSGDIAVGDAVIGLASSGVHSNGFSLVRKIVENSGVGFDAPAPFSPVMTLGGALLAPTRLYVKSCLRAIRETGERRQQRGVDVEHSAVPALHEFGGEQPHESAKTNQLDLVFLQRPLQDNFEAGAVLAERLARDNRRRDAARGCLLEPRRIGPVGNDGDNLGRKIRSLRRIDQRGHVRSAPRDQDGDTTLHCARSSWPL